jgi:hypothetical protein
MCHNPDNFEPLAEVCTGVWSILVGEPSNIIRSGIREKIILLQFWGLLHMSVQNPDNFGYVAEVCVAVWTILHSGIFCVRIILNWADTDLLRGFWGSCPTWVQHESSEHSKQ